MFRKGAAQFDFSAAAAPLLITRSWSKKPQANKKSTFERAPICSIKSSLLSLSLYLSLFFFLRGKRKGMHATPPGAEPPPAREVHCLFVNKAVLACFKIRGRDCTSVLSMH